jgi:hypothetical protein
VVQAVLGAGLSCRSTPDAGERRRRRAAGEPVVLLAAGFSSA